MAEPGTPYWTIRHLESGESVPGQTFTVFIAEGDSEDARYFDLQRMIEEPGQQENRSRTGQLLHRVGG